VRTHPFDAVAFVFGAIFVTVATVGLTDVATFTLTDLRWLGPAALVLVGIVLTVSAARRDPREEQQVHPEGTASAAGPGDDPDGAGSGRQDP
jgi:branched-subunit amino acid permease